MKWVVLASMLILALTHLFVPTVYSQMAESAELEKRDSAAHPEAGVIYDLNGRWDALYELWDVRKTLKTVLDIRQKGSYFVIVKQGGSSDPGAKGEEIFRGELGKDGITKAEFRDGPKWAPATGVITHRGNMIMLYMESLQGTLTLWRSSHLFHR